MSPRRKTKIKLQLDKSLPYQIKRLVFKNLPLITVFYTIILITFGLLIYEWTRPLPDKIQEKLAKKIVSINKNIPFEQAKHWLVLIDQELAEYPWLGWHGYDRYMVLGHIMTESEFNVAHTSPAWAIGLMQLQYRTAEDSQEALEIYLGEKHHRLYDPYINLKMGIHHMGVLVAKYKSLDRALLSYWAGVNGAKSLTEKQKKMYIGNVKRFRMMFIKEVS